MLTLSKATLTCLSEAGERMRQDHLQRVCAVTVIELFAVDTCKMEIKDFTMGICKVKVLYPWPYD